jgi:hypothetical protein
VWGVFLPINMDHTPPEKTRLFQLAATPPTLSPQRTRGPSSPVCVASSSVRVDILEVLHLEHLDRTSRTCKSKGREQLHCLLPSTRSSTSRRFRCICASSGNPVISDSSSSCFAGKILFCASVATPYPFTISPPLLRPPCTTFSSLIYPKAPNVHKSASKLITRGERVCSRALIVHQRYVTATMLWLPDRRLEREQQTGNVLFSHLHISSARFHRHGTMSGQATKNTLQTPRYVFIIWFKM